MGLDATRSFSDHSRSARAGADFPGVASASQRYVWTSLSPDPNLRSEFQLSAFQQKEPEVPGDTCRAASPDGEKI